MKKIFLIVAMFFTVTIGFSQTQLTTAVDFTVTDVNGVDQNLFSILDEGKYVVIEFFFTN